MNEYNIVSKSVDGVNTRIGQLRCTQRLFPIEAIEEFIRETNILVLSSNIGVIPSRSLNFMPLSEGCLPLAEDIDIYRFIVVPLTGGYTEYRIASYASSERDIEKHLYNYLKVNNVQVGTIKLLSKESQPTLDFFVE